MSDARDLAWFMRRLLQGEVLHEAASLARMTGRGRVLAGQLAAAVAGR
ncbi:MAG: hypothetical protein ABR506_04970 [Candidatus Krumholzibacteriia bacterium]